MSVRRAIFCSVASASAIVSTAAFAADLPTKKRRLSQYLQLFPIVGRGSTSAVMRARHLAQTTDLTAPNTFIGSPGLRSFTGGGLVGYNYQFSTYVVGAEGEFGFDDRSGSSTYGTGAGSRAAHFDGDFIGRIRGRLGYAIGNALVYGAGGVSFADGTLRNTNTANVPPFSISVREEYTGWNLGLGAEYAFTSNWIVRGEYIYDQLGRETYNFGFPP